MTQKDLKLQRIEEIKKMIFLDVGLFFGRNKETSKPLTPNGFLNKKAHEYQIGGYEFNLTKEEITEIYENELDRRGYIFWQTEKDQEKVNNMIKHLGIKQGDVLSQTRYQTNWKYKNYYQVASIRWNNKNDMKLLTLKGYDAFSDDKGKPYYFQEYNLNGFSLSDDKQILKYVKEIRGNIYEEEFRKENNPIEKELLGNSGNDYIIKDYLHSYGQVFINGIKEDTISLSDEILQTVGGSQYFNLSKKSFCINSKNKLIQIDNSHPFLQKKGIFKGIDFNDMYYSGLIGTNAGDTKERNLLYIKGDDGYEHILKEGELVYTNEISVNKTNGLPYGTVKIINCKSDVLLLTTKTNFYSNKANYTLMEYNSNTNKFDVFYKFSLEDDIDEIFYNAHDKILFYSEKIMKNNEYYYKFHCIDVRSGKSLKIQIGDKIMKTVEDFDTFILTKVFLHNNIIEFGRYLKGKYYLVKFVAKYENKGNICKLQLPSNLRTIEKENIKNFNILENGKCFIEKSRITKEIDLEKYFN